MATLIRRRVLRRLIWACNVRLCPTKRTLGLYGLTHLSRMEFPTSINWTNPFPFKGLLGCICLLYSNFKRTFFKQTVETLIRRRVLWRLIWVCNVRLCPTKGTLGLYGLRVLSSSFTIIALRESRPRGYKTFFMLNSTEHETLIARTR